MNTGKLVLIIAVFLLAFGLVMGAQNTVLAVDAQLIQVSSSGEGKMAKLTIDPADAHVKKDAIVIWLSAVQPEEIKIEFADGKKCKSVTAHAVGFDLDQERWCYVTSYVPFAGSSSLQFTEVGTYEYSIYTKEGATAKGKIIVE